MRVRADLLVAALTAVSLSVVACGPATDGERTVSGGTLGGFGELPAAQATDNAGQPLSTTTPPSTVPVSTVPDAETVGALAAGNRVLVIGDSILAATSSRYTNDMCEALVPLGWRVEVEAESGRFIDFGDDVLDDRLTAGWDAAVIMLGNNYREDQARFREDMIALIDRLAPRPVLLLTVTEWTESREQVNAVVRELAAARPEVLVAEWALETADGAPEAQRILGADGLHLSDLGRQRIAALVAASMGAAPTQPGSCLESVFVDDSDGTVDGSTTTTTRPRGNVTTTTRPRSSTTTTKPPTTPPTSPPTTITTSSPPTT